MSYELAEETEPEVAKDDSLNRLKKAKAKFQQSVEHDIRYKAEAHRALRFYSNSELTGQWEVDDLAYLVEQGRPAFTFNIIAAKVSAFLGFYADAQRKAIIGAAGGEDAMHAEVLNILVEQVLQDADYERKASRQLRTGAIAGDCSLHIEVEPSQKGKGWVQVNLYRILPFEIHWDASSIEPDRKDARCVFWDRWLTQDEYDEAYPGQEAAYVTAEGSGDAYGGKSDMDGGWAGSEGGNSFSASQDDYDDGAELGRYYYDRHENKIRVIRYEYKTFIDRLNVINTETGESREIGDEKKEQIEHAIALGYPMELDTQRVEVVKVMEFIGTSILAEYDEAGPFDGFSIVPFTYEMDEETGTPFGIVRNLFDPQQEINKGKSLGIEHMAQSIQVGSTIEEGAVSNQEQYADQIRQPGGVAIVKDGALTENRVRDRVPSPPDAAGVQRTAGAIDLMNEISGMPSTANISPGEAAQAGITVAIRFNKAKQSVSQPFGNFEDSQSSVFEKVLQTITRAMPDDQIQTILSSDEWMVQNGMVVQMAPAPDGSGQMQPKARAEIRNLRSQPYDLEMEYGSENSTLRMIEFDSLERLNASGVPVDPEVLVELAASNRTMQERLKDFVEKTKTASEQAAQKAEQQASDQANAGMQLQKEQMLSIVQTEMAKVGETARHNQATEGLTMQKQHTDVIVSWAELWEAADAEEKSRIVQWAKIQQAREGATTGAAIA